jgi:hypothetical protein
VRLHRGLLDQPAAAGLGDDGGDAERGGGRDPAGGRGVTLTEEARQMWQDGLTPRAWQRPGPGTDRVR